MCTYWKHRAVNTSPELHSFGIAHLRGVGSSYQKNIYGSYRLYTWHLQKEFDIGIAKGY